MEEQNIDAMTASQRELAVKMQQVLELLREAEVEEVVVRFRGNPSHPPVRPRIIFEVEDLIAVQ